MAQISELPSSSKGPETAPALPVVQAPPVLSVPLGRTRITDRQARRRRARARAAAAQRLKPLLRIDRMTPILAILRAYRDERSAPLAGPLRSPSPLAAYVHALRREVEGIEAWARARSRRAQEEGETIRRALAFLRSFGRMMSLDLSSVPVEDRDHLVALFALEHRWCYAAAGTTRCVFKIAIGRTGAR